MINVCRRFSDIMAFERTNSVGHMILQTDSTASNLQIETRMSKGSPGCFFSHFFLLSGVFFPVIVGKKRSTRHLKAETLYFWKIKILRHVEYSTPPEWGLKSTWGPEKAPFHEAKNAKYGS